MQKAQLLSILFEELYHRFAWAYDAVAAAVSLGRWKQWAAAILPLIQGEHVVELGCGPGHLLARQTVVSPIGLDESCQMLRQTRRHTPSHTPLVRARAEALPFSSSSLDCVYATFPSATILGPESLNEVHRTLKPGGIFVFAPGVRFPPNRVASRLLAGMKRSTSHSPTDDAPTYENILKRLSDHGLTATYFWIPAAGASVALFRAQKAP